MDNTVDVFDCYWQADNLENICGYNARKYGQQNVTGPCTNHPFSSNISHF